LQHTPNAPPSTPSPIERFAPLAALALAALFLAQAIPASLDESLTWDETGYIAAGYANLWQGFYGLNADHPPGMQKLSALPLSVPNAPLADAPRFLESENPRAAYGREFFFGTGIDVEAASLRARAPVLLIAAGLVLAVFAWGRSLFGTRPALLAATLAALCPPLLAHGRLATEDMGCTAGMFVAVWMLWRATLAPSLSRAALCGIAVGGALLTKYTALLLAPIFVLLWLAPPAAGRRLPIGHVLLVTGIALGVASFGYGWTPRPDLYLGGILRIYPDIGDDYFFYFAGQVSDEAFAVHGLASLVAKLPASALACLGLGAGLALRRRDTPGAIWLLVPPAVVLLASALDITNPGIRRVLPAVPFLLLFAASAAKDVQGQTHRVTLVAIVIAAVLEAGFAYPRHLAFQSPLAGGAEGGPYLFDDSNVDWGQDLPALARWQRQHQRPDETLTLHYFGSAEPAYYGVVAQPFDLDQLEDPPPGLYAVSAHYLVFYRKIALLDGADSDWLSKFTPVDRARSIYLYRFGDGSEASSAAASASRPSRR
jgi:hypothetical protein